eukprot:Hpha_TRINITY_DN15970_c1_g8::TRINITY_DN15970_c1_g8_i2::g.71447::m.71447
MLEEVLNSLNSANGEGGELGEEEQKLQQLVKQGLSLMRNDGGADEQQLLTNCLGLLDSITKEIGGGEAGGAAAEGGQNGDLVNQLQSTLAEMVKDMGEGGEGADTAKKEEALQKICGQLFQQDIAGLTDAEGQQSGKFAEALKDMENLLGAPGAAGAAGPMTEEQREAMEKEQKELLDALKQMQAKADGDEAGPGLGSDDFLKDLLKGMQSKAPEGQEAPDAAEALKDLQKLFSGAAEGGGGDPGGELKALQDILAKAAAAAGEAESAAAAAGPQPATAPAAPTAGGESAPAPAAAAAGAAPTPQQPKPEAAATTAATPTHVDPSA